MPVASGVDRQLLGTDPTMANGYMGVLVLLFAAMALFRRWNPVERVLVVFGGICLLAADQLDRLERGHIEACARVVLDTRDGTLAARLGRPVDVPARLPRLEPTLSDEVAAGSLARPALRFDNGTGGFTADGREYVVSVSADRSTPAPWCNVLANPEFGCLVSESSLGVTWSLNSGENRLTPWRNDPVLDPPSEVLYLRDEETAAVWSTTPLPAGDAGATMVRHGAGYTAYHASSHGLDQTLTVFVPPEASLKVVRLRIKNSLARHRRLTATYYAEWVLGSRREDQRAYIVSEYDQANACLLATCKRGVSERSPVVEDPGEERDIGAVDTCRRTERTVPCVRAHGVCGGKQPVGEAGLRSQRGRI
jgi:cellobiose phosphorylase